MLSAVEKWKFDLALWAIPQEILDQAEVEPWFHPAALFALPEVIEDSPSHQKAREAMPVGGTVLDIGCGGGTAAFAIAPPAKHLIGVDHQSEMLEMFSSHAEKRGLTSEVFEGFWPAIAEQVPAADVVTCHHVLFNVGDVQGFIEALDSHARKRVVIELPLVHPTTSRSPGWKHFWNLIRPTTPTADDLMNVLEELGIPAHIEKFTGKLTVEEGEEDRIEYTRKRLCLPKPRTDEIVEFLKNEPNPTTREVAVVWWDKV
ncbi:AdoMet_MTases domain containing protein [Candidatus Nanopelagicaceae bacterium]